MNLQNIITFNILSYYDSKIKNWIKALKATSSQDGIMTKEDFVRLHAIEEGAQLNVIETVKVDNVALVPDSNKAVNIDLSKKIDKLEIGEGKATVGNFLGIDTDGNIVDSGKKNSDFASIELGNLANSALQTISNGTDGTYVTTTIGDKTGDDGAKDLTISVAVTTQDPSTADTEHNGLATALEVKRYVSNLISAGVRYKGSVTNYTALQAVSNPDAGDMYNVKDDEIVSGEFYPGDMNYVYVAASGETPAFWDPLSPIINISYCTESQVNELFV